MAEPFIYTSPVAGQQAVQYAQLQAQQEMDNDRQISDLFRQAGQNVTNLGLGAQQVGVSRAQMQQRALEAEKDRELARQGYASAQTVAGITAGQRGDVLKARLAADDAANKAFALDNFNRGSSFAEMLNNANTPLSLRQKLMQSGDVVMGADGVWRSRHANPNPVESIDNIRMRVQGIPGSMGVGGRIPAAMDSMPSRARMMQMGPATVDFPSAPPGPSPFETPGFQVFRQSDIINRTVPVPVEVPVDQPWMQTGY